MAKFKDYYYNGSYVSCKTTDENGNLVLEQTETVNSNTNNKTYFKTKMVFSSTFIKVRQTKKKVVEGKTSEILSCQIDKNKIGSFSFNKHDNSAYYWFKISVLDEEDKAIRFNILVNEEIKSEILKFLNDNNITSSQAIEDKITAKFREAQVIKLQKEQQKKQEEEKKNTRAIIYLIIIAISFLLCHFASSLGGSSSSFDWEKEAKKQGYVKENGKWNYEGDGAY